MFFYFSVLGNSWPLGVPPNNESKYKTNIRKNKGNFKCFDNSKIISKSQINDNYADCKDGSDEPGTSAWSNGFFYCKNNGK